MKAEQWEQIDNLFHAALERAPGQRLAFIDQACAGDETLRKEVEALIRSHQQAGSFIESPAGDLAAELLADGRDEVVGRRVGPYKIVNLLGRGGMGEVYLAEDCRLGRRVALKLLPAQFTKDEDRLHRFEREARAASALNHPNIITIHEIGQVDGEHFIVTEFIEGRTLRERMASTTIAPREALDVAIQTASALEAAHKAGIVHRDIKPENIMLRPDGLVKVLDFGLAKLTEMQSADTEASTLARVQTRTGMVMGTVTYMSPEQARGLAVDARSDIFSLGIVIYEMIAGRAPFDGATTSDVIVSILEREPPPLSRYATEVPAELERIVKKALAKVCEGRYQTVKDVLIDLKNLKELELQAKLGAAAQASFKDAASATTAAQRTVETDRKSAIRAGEAELARATSSAEYLIEEIKTHKRAGVLGLVTLAIAITAFVFFWTMNRPKLPPSDRAVKTIAVLPFKPLAADSRNESLELGMADTLINKLSGIKQLIVRPISDVRRYTRLEQDPIAAGRELGVDYVLEGNLQMVGEKTRATVRLLSVKDGSAIWTDKCDQQCSTIFDLQDAIAERIAGMLALRLTGDEKKQLAKHYTENAEAYQLYSLGVYSRTGQGGVRGKERFEKSIEYFERAIKIDPNYALAYVGLSEAYANLGRLGFWPPNEARQRYEWAALKAVELDDTLAEAHAGLALVRKWNWDWAGAEREHKRAIELDPNSYEVNSPYVPFLVDVGRLDEALVYAKRTDELALGRPGSFASQQAYVYLHMRQYDKAIELYLKLRERNPNSARGNFFLAEAYLGKGMYEEAIDKMQKVVADDNGPERWNGYPILAYAYAVAGRRDEALKILDEQKELAKHSYISPYNFAIIYTGLGDKDRAFEWLEKAYEERSGSLSHFKSRPMFDSLRSDPRFAELLRKMNLAP